MFKENSSTDEIIRKELNKWGLAEKDLTAEQLVEFRKEILLCQAGGCILDGIQAELPYIAYKSNGTIKEKP